MDPDISIVIPVYNEETNLRPLAEEIFRVMGTVNRSFEWLLVDDGSSDNSASIMHELADRHHEIRILHLSRNFGHQPAVSAGMSMARGRAVIVMDADLQDPPELIPVFIEKWQEGYQVVYGIREEREGNPVRNFFYKLFYRSLGRLSQIHIPSDSGDFALSDRVVVDQMVKHFPEHNRFLRGIRAYAGFRQTGIPYRRPERFSGSSKYPLRKLIALAMDGWFGFSTTPLRLATYLGLLFAVPSFLIGLVFVLNKLFGFRIFSYPPTDLPGVATIAVAIFFIGGLILILLGVIGEYISRIYLEVKQRPTYIIAEEYNGKQQDSAK